MSLWACDANNCFEEYINKIFLKENLRKFILRGRQSLQHTKLANNKESLIKYISMTLDSWKKLLTEKYNICIIISSFVKETNKFLNESIHKLPASYI